MVVRAAYHYPYGIDSSIEEEFKLFNLTDVDRATLRQTDEQFVPHDWEELKTIVGKAPNPLSP